MNEERELYFPPKQSLLPDGKIYRMKRRIGGYGRLGKDHRGETMI